MLKNEQTWLTNNERMMAQVICVLIGIVKAQDARISAMESLPIVEASKDALRV